jgi:hypothetical protein
MWLVQLKSKVGDARWNNGHFTQAINLFREFSTSRKLADFLTVPAYDILIQSDTIPRSRM